MRGGWHRDPPWDRGKIEIRGMYSTPLPMNDNDPWAERRSAWQGGNETDSSLDCVKMKFNTDQESVLYCSSTDPIPQVQMGDLHLTWKPSIWWRMLGIQIEYGFNICQEWLLKKLMQLEARNPVMSGTAGNAWKREEGFQAAWMDSDVFCGSREGRIALPRDKTAALTEMTFLQS